MRNYYNFTLPLTKKKRIPIAFTNIEFDGWVEFGLIFSIMAIVYIIFNAILKSVLGEFGGWLAIVAALSAGIVVYLTSQNIDSKTEKNFFKTFYYSVILRYTPIKNERGEQIFINMKKKKGVIFNVHSQPLRVQKHRKRI